MATDDQVRANRANAQLSHGPNTDAGKERVRFNALRHGLTAQAALLPGEDADRHRVLVESLHAYYQPVGEVEELLVDVIAASLWRLRRVTQVESGLYVWLRSTEIIERPIPGGVRDAERAALEVLDRHGARGPEGERALQLRQEAETERAGELALLGAAFIRDASGPNAFSKLARYETTIRNSLFRALNDLERMQSARVANRAGGEHTRQHDPSEEDGGPEGP